MIIEHLSENETGNEDFKLYELFTHLSKSQFK